MMNILAMSIARAGGIEVAADRRVVPAPRPVSDHSAALLSSFARGAAALAAVLDRGARHLAARRRIETRTC